MVSSLADHQLIADSFPSNPIKTEAGTNGTYFGAAQGTFIGTFDGSNEMASFSWKMVRWVHVHFLLAGG